MLDRENDLSEAAEQVAQEPGKALDQAVESITGVPQTDNSSEKDKDAA